MIRCTINRQTNSSSDAVIYWTMTGTHVVPDSSMMGTHQLHLAWFTYNCCTESFTPPPVDLTPIPHLLLYANSRASHFGQHVIHQALKQTQKNRQLGIISRTYILPSIYTTHDKQTTKYSDPISTTSGETMNKYDTGNYKYCIKNTTAVWNLTPPPANLALTPQQHVINQESKQI